MNMLSLDRRDNYVIIQLVHPPVNALNHAMISEIRKTMAKLDQDPEIHGAILTGRPGMFCAGLDIKELHSLERPQFREFLLTFRSMVKEIAAFSKPLVAAMTGHAPAGGCILGICCDYRVMAAGTYKIGLNEVPVGLYAPPYVLALYAQWIGQHAAYQALLEGRLFQAEEALSIGLVDELAAVEAVVSRAETQLRTYLALPSPAWKLTKRALRRDLLASFEVDLDQTLVSSEALWWEQGGRDVMGNIIQGLEKR
ncbi:MAG: enoyl-CoA hydratase/isomerase family protein [Bacteroidota bacterium]